MAVSKIVLGSLLLGVALARKYEGPFSDVTLNRKQPREGMYRNDLMKTGS